VKLEEENMGLPWAAGIGLHERRVVGAQAGK
jgi:hypothetical protein